MKKKYKYIKNNTSGFTLIELLVVISIIGIVSAIVLSNFSNYRNSSKEVMLSRLGVVLDATKVINETSNGKVDLKIYLDESSNKYMADIEIKTPKTDEHGTVTYDTTVYDTYKIGGAEYKLSYNSESNKEVYTEITKTNPKYLEFNRATGGYTVDTYVPNIRVGNNSDDSLCLVQLTGRYYKK